MNALRTAGLVALASTTAAFAGAPTFKTAVSMNFYDLAANPTPGHTVIMGERDINYLTVTGEPFGTYQLQTVGNLGAGFMNGTPIPGLGPWGVRNRLVLPVDPIVGLLDETGRAQIQLPSRYIRAGNSFSLVATVDNGSATPSQLAANAVTVRSKSGFIMLQPGAGSLAHARGCLMGMDIAAQRIWIGNIEYALDGKTEFANFNSLDELVVGKTWLNVNGRYGAAGQFIANEVGLEDMEPFTRLEGRVQGKGASGLIIMNVSAFVSPDTVIFDHDTGAGRTFDDVQPFMPVEIWIDTNNTMYPHIVQMSIDTPIEPEPEPEPEVENENEDPPPSYCG